MQDVTTEPRTIKVAEAAKILGIGRQTAYVLAREGKLPGARRLGRRIVVSRVALEAFLSADKEQTQQPEVTEAGPIYLHGGKHG